jgi:hypothetical protein
MAAAWVTAVCGEGVGSDNFVSDSQKVYNHTHYVLCVSFEVLFWRFHCKSHSCKCVG